MKWSAGWGLVQHREKWAAPCSSKCKCGGSSDEEHPRPVMKNISQHHLTKNKKNRPANRLSLDSNWNLSLFSSPFSGGESIRLLSILDHCWSVINCCWTRGPSVCWQEMPPSCCGTESQCSNTKMPPPKWPTNYINTQIQEKDDLCMWDGVRVAHRLPRCVVSFIITEPKSSRRAFPLDNLCKHQNKLTAIQIFMWGWSEIN